VTPFHSPITVVVVATEVKIKKDGKKNFFKNRIKFKIYEYVHGCKMCESINGCEYVNEHVWFCLYVHLLDLSST
jgi:hypothetical protein